MSIFINPNFIKENRILIELKQDPYQLILLEEKKTGIDDWVYKETSIIKIIISNRYIEQIKIDLILLDRYIIVLDIL
ncbi:046933ed-86a4-4e58-a86d-9069d62bd70b-CDS [Sclerotinia trifoliorum]|uniref:046933ed-86a4-4e58-a86d-9069d62bd70b-CDS n=1 Tax=Sclerotinia trifoliorum TaxID=28548 RepID=A0A8H2W0U1_9HELO|nr:046933ed-86a4-4e58-a86d-9069d62bd70b-CDS [Sclerotinia trifoliorum]